MGNVSINDRDLTSAKILTFAFSPGKTMVGRPISKHYSRPRRTTNTNFRRSRTRQTPIMHSAPQSQSEDNPTHNISHASPPLTPEAAADKQAIDSLASEGKSSLQDLGGAVMDDLESIQASTQAYADELIAEETEALLAKYDEQQEELLAAVDDDRRIIEEQMKRIQELTGKMRDDDDDVEIADTPLREKALAAAAGLFAIAAIVYAWTGFVQDDSVALQNAGLDAVVAAAAVYFVKNGPKDGK